MSSTIDEIVKQAYKKINQSSEYKIPKIEQLKKQNLGKKKVCVCISCGNSAFYADRKPARCEDCRKKISYLYRKRKSKGKKMSIDIT